ncbi:hypothetical protein GCM10010520_21660 [Rhizobium viscosum]|uniref:Uncharacterized protein n=1 Tax=Rhizobium viscosum TaxID=1673 RepID=A0ABR9IID5_RHIVS|nr:hypothetical protein [Rhizobium viscosum]MBE1502936.1 hypothetical protein [Rhizobium viscosum]
MKDMFHGRSLALFERSGRRSNASVGGANGTNANVMHPQVADAVSTVTWVRASVAATA